MALLTASACIVVGLAAADRARAETAPALALIPMPHALALSGERRGLAGTLVIASDTPQQDAYAIQVLRGLPASRAGAPMFRRVRLLAQRPDGLPERTVAEQGYSIECRGDSIVVRGETAAARLHGAETLRQLALAGNGWLPAGRIVDGPALRVRGMSLDVSRGRMPTFEDLRATLDLCAAFKLNTLLIYLEDTFEYSRVPVAARSRDALDAVTLRRLTAEARRRSIELVPIVETLSHQEHMLSHPSMRAHAEIPPPGASAMFAVTRRATRELVGSMVDDVLAASGATAIHLGCDEPTELSQGGSAEAVRRLGIERVYAEHVRTLAERARARFGARAWIYADLVRARPALATLLPRDVVLVDWDYASDATFASLDTLASSGLGRVVTSPGLWSWSTPYPDYARAHASIEAATAAARTRGCMGSVLASWGDGGGEDLTGNDVLGLAYFAEHAWNDAPCAFEPFVSRYAELRFAPGADGMAAVLASLSRLSLPNGAPLEQLVYHPILVRSRTAPWRACMVEVQRVLTTACPALERATPHDLHAGAELEAMRAACARMLAAAHRELTLDSIATRLAARDASSDAGLASWSGNALARLHLAEGQAQAAYASAWRARNRTSGLPMIEARFAAQLAALDSLRTCAERATLHIVGPGERLAGVEVSEDP